MSAQATPRPGPLAVRVKQACELLGVEKNKVYELLKTGELPSFKDGNCRLIPMSGIEAYLARKLTQSPRPPAVACGSCGQSGPGSYDLGSDGVLRCATCAAEEQAPQTA